MWSQWTHRHSFQFNPATPSHSDSNREEPSGVWWLSCVILRWFIFMYWIFTLVDAVTKIIAQVYQCLIVVRDANRIHHFHPNGQCSCGDHFWKALFQFVLSLRTHFCHLLQSKLRKQQPVRPCLVRRARKSSGWAIQHPKECNLACHSTKHSVQPGSHRCHPMSSGE